MIDKKVSDVLKDFDITHIQFNILRELEAVHPGILSVTEIQKGLLFPTSDVTRLLDRLEKKGLVNRTICPKNRRKVEISITNEGLQTITSSVPEIESALEGFYSDKITEKERDQVRKVLKKIRKQ
jgi:DNA-binding MarR family transcriptional regulator